MVYTLTRPGVNLMGGFPALLRALPNDFARWAAEAMTVLPPNLRPLAMLAIGVRGRSISARLHRKDKQNPK